MCQLKKQVDILVEREKDNIWRIFAHFSQYFLEAWRAGQVGDIFVSNFSRVKIFLPL